MVQASMFHACYQPRNAILHYLCANQSPMSKGHAHDKNTCMATPLEKTEMKFANIDDTKSTAKSHHVMAAFFCLLGQKHLWDNKEVKQAHFRTQLRHPHRRQHSQEMNEN